ncbi:MAG: HdeD family acid-resistance protein [Hyphomicrobiaceae bacterium]
MTTDSTADLKAEAARIRFYIADHWGWFLGVGLLLALAGAAAIAFPFFSTVAAKVALGWLLLFTGIVNVIHAFATWGWRAFAHNLLVGLLFVAAGAYLAFFPLTGIITITILLAALFIAEGYLELMMALRLQPDAGWGWVLLSGILAIGAGVMIGLGLPDSSTWVLGLLTGINLLASGLSFIFLALSGRSASKHHMEQTA